VEAVARELRTAQLHSGAERSVRLAAHRRCACLGLDGWIGLGQRTLIRRSVRLGLGVEAMLQPPSVHAWYARCASSSGLRCRGQSMSRASASAGPVPGHAPSELCGASASWHEPACAVAKSLCTTRTAYSMHRCIQRTTANAHATFGATRDVAPRMQAALIMHKCNIEPSATSEHRSFARYLRAAVPIWNLRSQWLLLLWVRSGCLGAPTHALRRWCLYI
jgi:hypothetical protein